MEETIHQLLQIKSNRNFSTTWNQNGFNCRLKLDHFFLFRFFSLEWSIWPLIQLTWMTFLRQSDESFQLFYSAKTDFRSPSSLRKLYWNRNLMINNSSRLDNSIKEKIKQLKSIYPPHSISGKASLPSLIFSPHFLLAALSVLPTSEKMMTIIRYIVLFLNCPFW